MKAKKMSKITAVFTALIMVLALAPVGAGFPFHAADNVYAEEFNIPEADWTYDADHDWEGTLYINENATVKFSGVTHSNESTTAGAAIIIDSNKTVNLVFEGTNVLTANTNVLGAGIEVKAGSTVNIYGLDGSSLTVTGGKYSAGIGGIGYTASSKENPPAGNINIYSGTITAIGGPGEGGAGIGSGFHSSAGDIHIYGGHITALGTNCGAGIGTGYGTSGGADSNPTIAKMGYYHGGNITISGGTVRAAGYHMNFDRFDPYDPSTLYSDGYADTFAAGIGGGYGASSGNILIEGDADVTAVGSCGGAGIGTGRGTTDVGKYDNDSAHCHVTITDNAIVIAMTTADRRAVNGDDSGTGIGLGRGWNIDGTPKGDVTIGGNANVYAYADESANGIGTGTVVAKYGQTGDGIITYPTAAHLETLSIGSDCTVTAISNGQKNPRNGFNEDLNLDTTPAAELHFTDQFFADNSEFLTEDKFPLKVDVCSVSDSTVLATFSLSDRADQRVGLHFPSSAAQGAYLRIKDYKDNDVGVLITHDKSSEVWKYEKGDYTPVGLMPEEYGITYNLNGGTNASSNHASYKIYQGAVKLADPTRSGYTFGGWYDNAQLSGSKVTGIPAGSTGEKQFWAKWTKQADPVVTRVDKTLIVKAVAKGKKLVYTWNAVPGAKGYDIYFAKCAGNPKYKKVKTVSGSTLKWTKAGLKKKSTYQVYVKAWAKKKGKKTYIAKSPATHAFTNGGNAGYSNAKSLTVAKTEISVAKGKTAAIKAKVKLVNSKKKLMHKSHAPKFRYLSSDKKVATVSKKGKIKGVAPGTCYVYVFTHNGISKKIEVTVK